MGDYGQRGYDDDMLERAFEEGCRHGYRKAMMESGSFEERRGRDYGFEEKMERLRRRYE